MVMIVASTALLAQQVPEKSKNSGLERERAAVAKLEDQWLTALNNADVDAIAKILGDDFLRPAPDPGRFVNKADLLSFYRSHLSPQGPDKRRIENMTVTVYGPTALARGELTTTNSEGHVIRKVLFTDVFVQRDGKWQAVSAQENPGNYATDFQSLSHEPAAPCRRHGTIGDCGGYRNEN
jgi:ketosteroid isomerase-like protein